MSNESIQSKFDCPLIEKDGNIFNLVGIAASTLKRNDLSDEASEMTSKVFKSGSYEETLGIIWILTKLVIIRGFGYCQNSQSLI